MILDDFIEKIKGKNIFIATHWDADGVSSGAILYHFIKRYANIVGTLSKGVIFKVNKDEISNSEYDFILVSDIIPGNLDKNKTIYIDHHPNNEEFIMKIHDENEQSCSIVLWKNLIYEAILRGEIKKSEIPYFTFLTLLGYFGDGGKEENIPLELYILAKESIPDLMKWNNFFGRYLLEIEKYVPLLNIGKRKHWDGTLPLQMLITSSKVEEIIYGTNPLVKQLNEIRKELRQKYKYPVEIIKSDKIDYGIIDCESNIQGVICARLMNDKPILIINRYMDYAIGSMRVPDNLDFNAGNFLKELSKNFEIIEAGGHEKAAGITFWKKDLDKFITKIKEYNLQ